MGKVLRAFRRTALPLAAYYAITLIVPLANGPAHFDGFVGHALVVLVVPPLAICLGCAVHTAVAVLPPSRIVRFGGAGRRAPGR